MRFEGFIEKGTIDWERVRRMNARGFGGEYCILSVTVVGFSEVKNRESIISSEISSESVLILFFSFFLFNIVEVLVFEAFGVF